MRRAAADRAGLRGDVHRGGRLLPGSSDGGALYQAQVTALVAAGRSLLRVDPGPPGPEIVFKAELGSVTPWAVQVQGVWVSPSRRGEGLAAPGMAAVVAAAGGGDRAGGVAVRERLQPPAVRSVPARRLPQVGTFATVPVLTGRPGRGAESGRGAPPRWVACDVPNGLEALVLLRMSTLFLRTLREDPADAEVPSHRLLVRAGYIRRAAPGHLHLAAAGLRVLRNVERIVREEMDATGVPGGALPGAAAARALRGDRPLDRVRRQPVPAQGPQGRRLPARPHPRGDVHPAGEGPVLLVQGPAAGDLPDPDQVPRRGPPARRAAARPRVRDEGLLLLRRRRRRAGRAPTSAPRRLHQDLRPARAGLRDRRGDVRGDGRQQRARSSCSPTEVGEDTFVRCGRCDYAANVEAVATPVPAVAAGRRAAGRPRRGHPGHPDHRHPGRRGERDSSRAPTGPGRRRTR